MGAQLTGEGMAAIILDTDVFIDHFRGVEAATEYLGSLSVRDRRVTDVTVMELMKGATDKTELRRIEEFLKYNGFTLLPITVKASRLAVKLLKEYGLSYGMSIPDALIAAITINTGGRLISGNWRHFAFIRNLSVELPPYRR